MSKGSKNKKKNIKVKEGKVVVSNTEKIEKCIYIFQFILFFIGVFGGIVGIGILILSLIYGLNQYYKTCIITIILSFLILFNYFTFGKFKEIRKKYGKGVKKNDSRKNRG